VKTGAVKIEAKKAFSDLLLYLIVPAMVINSYLRQHRTIPALRLKHRSGGCGTAPALPKCSIIHKVLSALLA
jgi:hypothetical protein